MYTHLIWQDVLPHADELTLHALSEPDCPAASK